MSIRLPAFPPRARAIALVVMAAVVCVGGPRRAAAQQIIDTTGPTLPQARPIFGGAAEGPRGPQSLILNAAVFGGYDDDIFARGQNTGVGRPRVGGEFLGTQATLGYDRRFATGSFQASGAGALRYLPETQETVPTFASLGMGFSRSLGGRTSVNVRQAFAYRPFFSPTLFPPPSTVGPSLGVGLEEAGGDPGFDVSAPDDFGLASDRDGVRYSAAGELTRNLTPRSRLEFRGQYGQADFGSDELSDVSNRRWRAGGSYNYDLTRHLGARLGYFYRSFNTRSGGLQVAHDINVGLVFNRPFVIRRGATSLSFTTGSTVLYRDRVEGAGDGDRLRVRAIGSATLARTFSRDWQGNLTYARSVAYMDGFPEPIEGDRVTASLGGLLTQALDLSMTAGYMSGAIGMRERNFDTALASARLRLALHARAALFAQYFYYHYSFRNGVADQLLAAPELERQGFRVGLNVWLPVVR